MNILVAMRVLTSNHSDCSTFILGQLLNTFVADFIILYGNDKVNYNIHNLLHFEQMQQNMGSLQRLNGFVYDKQLNTFNSIVESNPKVSLSEIGEKLVETSNIFIDNKTNDLMNKKFPYIEEEGVLVYKRFVVTTKEPDNYVLMTNGVVRVEAISSDPKTNNITIIGRVFSKSVIMFQAPLTTQRLVLVSDLGPIQSFDVEYLLHKVVKFDTKDGIFISTLIT